MNLLKDYRINKRFEEEVIKLVETWVPNLWGNFEDGVLRAYAEVFGV